MNIQLERCGAALNLTETDKLFNMSVCIDTLGIAHRMLMQGGGDCRHIHSYCECDPSRQRCRQHFSEVTWVTWS